LSIFLSYAYIFAQLGTLGTGRITIAVFPFFKDRSKNHHGFFPLMIFISSIGLVLAMILIFIIKPMLISNSNDQSPLLGQYFNFMFPLIFFTFLFLVLDSFNTTLFNAVRGIFLKEFIQRLLILVSITIYALALINFREFVMMFVLAVGIPAFVLMYYLLRNEDFCLKPAYDPLIKDKSRLMINLGFNGIIIGFSGMAILVMDRILVERIMGLGPTGIYTTLAYFATLVAIPSRALLKISDPIIAKSWKENDIKGLQDNYYRSSLNQFLIGSLIMIGLWGNIGNILRMLPPNYIAGKFVVLFLSLAFLSDMLTGTATYILANSKYFRYQTYYIIILVALIIITNYMLIPVWGLSGAAIATLGSKLISNFIRHQILYRKFGLQPYNYKFLIIILIAGISYLSQYFIPEISNIYLDIIIRSALMSLVFITLALGLKISPEVNERSRWLLQKIRKYTNGRQT
jgi:O-antigen/teichoic acid export membrane protein